MLCKDVYTKKMHFRFYLLILKKKFTSAKHQTPYNCVKNNINNYLLDFFYPIYFTYIQTLHKNNEFCNCYIFGRWKIYNKKAEYLGKSGGISKYEINIITCTSFVLDLRYNVLYEIMYKHLKYSVYAFWALKTE